MTQLMCKKTGSNSIRKAEPDLKNNCELELEKKEGMSLRRTGNDHPAACFEVVPKAMRNRCFVYEGGARAASNWSAETEWSDSKLICCQERRANV